LTLRLALTPGEPAGIGPDLAIIRAQQAHSYELVAFADPDLLSARAKSLGLPLTLRKVDLSAPPRPLTAGELGIVAIPLATACIAGKPSAVNAGYVLSTLDKAITACLQHAAISISAITSTSAPICHGLVTGPVQKSIINDAGYSFSGHTEYLAAKTGKQRVVMMLVTEGLRVALATTHLPLKEVSASISKDLLIDVITILHRSLQQQFGVTHPQILVCGLNPHAGEGGHLGVEEIETITPALNTLRQCGMDIVGPLPADTLFTPKHLANADAVLAMYHDQGLPVLKYKGFGQAANITLGLPIIRTSVDHGTALDLAGGVKEKINSGSLRTALDYAVAMAKMIKKSQLR